MCHSPSMEELSASRVTLLGGAPCSSHLVSCRPTPCPLHWSDFALCPFAMKHLSHRTMTKVALAPSSFLKTLPRTWYLPRDHGEACTAVQTDDTPSPPRWLWSSSWCEAVARAAAESAVRDEIHLWDLTVKEAPSGEVTGWGPRRILAALAETGWGWGTPGARCLWVLFSLQNRKEKEFRHSQSWALAGPSMSKACIILSSK